MPIGIPGIGKSTLLQQQTAQAAVSRVSPDDIRSAINGGDATFIPANEPQVWGEAFRQFKEALNKTLQGGPLQIIVDATNITVKRRESFLDTLKTFAQKHPVLLKVFHFPNDVALALSRQAGRSRQVDPAIISKMSKQFQPFTSAEITEPGAQIDVEIYDVAPNGTLTPVNT